MNYDGTFVAPRLVVNHTAEAIRRHDAQVRMLEQAIEQQGRKAAEHPFDAASVALLREVK